jgi:hypothetical protein
LFSALKKKRSGGEAMSRSMYRGVVVSLAGLAALAALATPARAQFRGPFFNPAPRGQFRQPQFPFGVSPVARPVVQPWFATQYNAGNIVAANIARNISTIGSGIASVPPWVFGYNPYVSPIAAGGFGPFGLSTIAGNPYAAGLSTGATAAATVAAAPAAPAAIR